MARPEKFGTKLDAALKARGMSRTRLAELVGIAQPKISTMIGGRQRPYLDQAQDIARVLEVPLAWLADDAQDELPAPDPEREFVLRLVADLGTAKAKRRLLGLPDEVEGAAPPPPVPNHVFGRLPDPEIVRELPREAPPGAIEGPGPTAIPPPARPRKAR